MTYIDSYFQLEDRALIAELKAEQFALALDEDKAQICQAQAQELRDAQQRYVVACVKGLFEPHQDRGVRFHDHKKAQAWEAMTLPTTVEGCKEALDQCHRRYWDTQSRVQAIKRLMERHPGITRHPLLAEFYEKQLVLDACNQLRSDLITQGDKLFAKRLKGDET